MLTAAFQGITSLIIPGAIMLGLFLAQVFPSCEEPLGQPQSSLPSVDSLIAEARRLDQPASDILTQTLRDQAAVHRNPVQPGGAPH